MDGHWGSWAGPPSRRDWGIRRWGKRSQRMWVRQGWGGQRSLLKVWGTGASSTGGIYPPLSPAQPPGGDPASFRPVQSLSRLLGPPGRAIQSGSSRSGAARAGRGVAIAQGPSCPTPLRAPWAGDSAAPAAQGAGPPVCNQTPPRAPGDQPVTPPHPVRCSRAVPGQA
ncbi:unnamed protein product [Natator depressus]